MTNLIVLYMDDMRYDGLTYMPKTRRLFGHEFTNARANGGACTDTRLGVHTGTWRHHHPWPWVRTATHFDPAATWAPWLRASGTTCGLFGKFISVGPWPAQVPDGWDHWRGYTGDNESVHDEYGYEVFDGSEILTPGRTHGVRNLDYMTSELIDWTTSTAEPFMAHWAPQHPHTITRTGEINPSPGSVTKWSWLHYPVDPDPPTHDKPAWVRDLPPLTPAQVADIQRAARGQARVLSDVDDAIDSLIDALGRANRLHDTVMIFSSDQGVHYGEQRWGNTHDIPAAVQKQTCYEPTVHIPLLARGPGFTRGTTTVPVSQCDITATAVAIADAEPSHPLDGIDLREVAARPDRYHDRTTAISATTFFTLSPSYDGLQTGPEHSRWPGLKYIRHENDEVELYDLTNDPGELVNLAHDPVWDATRAALDAELKSMLAT